MLKHALLLPPVVALAIAGTWLGSQHRSISTLVQESAVLRKAIAARSSTSPAAGSPSGKPASSAKEKEPLDWKKIAAFFAERQSSGNMGNRIMMMRFHRCLPTMTQEELVAAFDEIAALDLPAGSREKIENELLDPLVEKTPNSL